MSVELLLNSFRKKIPWPTMRAILRLCDLPVARGWEDTLEKILEEVNKGEELYENCKNLEKFYSDYILVGEKAVRLFSVDRTRIDNLIRLLKEYRLKSSTFLELYPFPLPLNKLKELDSSSKLVEIRDSEESLSLVFCARRSFFERIKIDPESFSEEARKKLDEYDEVFGIRQDISQFFDVVVLWKNKNLIEVRIDLGQDLSLQDRVLAFIEVIKQFNNLAYKVLGVKTLLQESINLFPLINKLYESTEGKVGELSFTTDEGSTKSERMRRGAVDLREEMYHKAGRNAVDHITPYRLAILWNFQLAEDVETQLELFLQGHANALNSKDPRLDEVLVKKCSTLRDYDFVLDKINTYLNSRDA